MTPEARHLRSLLESGRVEIRACDESERWWSGIFDDFDALCRGGRLAEQRAMAVYTSLNPSDRPVTNDLKPFRKSVRDDHVVRIRRLLFDLDPVRETGSGSDDQQLGYAEDRARVLRDTLISFGWPSPMQAMSGNGYHLQYHCDLPNNDQTATILTDLYRGLGVRITTAEVGFDTTVRNPSRICRMYGTTNRKSGRRSVILDEGSSSLITAATIKQTADIVKPPKPKAAPAVRKRTHRHWQGCDVVGLFQSMGCYKRDLGGGKHAVICPQCELHSSQDHPHKTDTVIWEGEYPQFHCSHAHCEGLTIHDVLDRFA